MIDFAIELAQNISHKGYRLACIITDKRGRILSTGFNSYSKTHPKQAYFAKKYGRHARIFLHAEMSALIRVKHGIPHHIYIARVDKKGNPRLAKPCPICYSAIRDSEIKKITYTNDIFTEETIV